MIDKRFEKEYFSLTDNSTSQRMLHLPGAVSTLGVGMKSHENPLGIVYILLIPVFIMALAGHARAIDNPYVRNPVGPATVPQSSMKSGLVSVPNPVDATGNMIVTGNVRGGKDFRGPLPYRSVTSFGSTLGSSSFDSFLRDSSGAEDIGESLSTYRGDFRPFYSPTATVTMGRYGYGGISTPASPRIATPAGSSQFAAVTGGFGLGQLTQVPAGGTQPREITNAGLQKWYLGRNWPIYRTPVEMEQVISNELGEQSSAYDTSSQEQTSGSERYHQQMQQIENRLKKANDQAQELRDSLTLGSEPRQDDMAESESVAQPPAVDSSLSKRAGVVARDARSLNLYKEQQQKSAELTSRDSAAEFGELSRAETSQGEGGISKQPGQTLPGLPQLSAGKMEVTQLTDSGKPQAGTGEIQKNSSNELPALERIRRTAKAFDALAEQREEPQTAQPAQPGLSTAMDRTTAVMEKWAPFSRAGDRLGRMDQAEQALTDVSAKTGTTKQKAFDSLSSQKYERYMNVAQVYMKQGRFYRAADAYALAGLYQPDDPFACAGRAHALFAAGEYISSSVFLAQCLEIWPEYLLQRVNLIGIMGGQVMFEQRLADLENSTKKTDSPEMHLLLAYVYYRIGELDRVGTAISKAQEKLGNIPAVLAIKRAIGDRKPSGSK